MSTHTSIVRSAGVIGFATLCSRLLGFIRDIVIARLFGVYVYAQAFVVAFRIPNLFRDLVGEGATNAAFVPVFSEYTVKHSREEFWELANVVLNLLLVVLSAITLLGIVFSPLIVRLIAPGFVADPHKFAATVTLNRIIFPYLLLICLAAYAMGVLNSLKHFAVPAFAPCLLNISIIVFALAFGEGIAGLASGVLVGGALQLAIQIPVLYRKGFRLRLFKRFRHPAANLIGKLMVPRLVSSSIYQLNNFVDSVFGSLALVVGDGGVAILYFSYRLIQFPLGIFSNALSQAILPMLSTQALEEDRDALRKTFSFGLRATFFVLLPASLGFIVLSRPVIDALFGGGRFDAYSVNKTAEALLFYSIGLFAYGATKMVQSCFFALKDTLTPAKVSAIALGLNVIFNVLLMFPMGISGLALATSLSGIITFVMLLTMLKKKIKPFSLTSLFFSFKKMLAASLCMAAVCFFCSRHGLIAGSGAFFKLANLGLVICAGILSYIVFCFVFGVKEIRELRRWFFRPPEDR